MDEVQFNHVKKTDHALPLFLTHTFFSQTLILFPLLQVHDPTPLLLCPLFVRIYIPVLNKIYSEMKI